MQNELKPCPFCGSDECGIAKTAYGNYLNIWFFAVCDKCGARSKASKNETEAAEAWNRRVNDG